MLPILKCLRCTPRGTAGRRRPRRCSLTRWWCQRRWSTGEGDPGPRWQLPPQPMSKTITDSPFWPCPDLAFKKCVCASCSFVDDHNKLIKGFENVHSSINTGEKWSLFIQVFLFQSKEDLSLGAKRSGVFWKRAPDIFFAKNDLVTGKESVYCLPGIIASFVRFVS